jgi:hypothetical protein
VKAACPNLLPYFYWAYDGPVELRSDFTTLITQSSTGVRQGDPLGPMLFCLGIAKAQKSIADRYPNLTFLSYLDDIFILGNAGDSIAAYEALNRKFGQLGLQFNANKSTLFTHAELPRSPIPVNQDGVNVLGIPVGTLEFVTQNLRQQSADQTRILGLLPCFSSPEAFSLLRTSVNTRPVYNVRGLPPHRTQEYTEEFDNKVSSALGKMVDSDVPLSDESIQIKNLPCHLGGLGMKCMSRIKKLAWSSSWLSSLRYIKANFDAIYSLTPLVQFDPAVIKSLGIPTPTPLQETGDSFAELVDPIISGDTIVSQKELSKALDQPTYDQLLTSLTETNPEAAAWLASSTAPGISSWLYCAQSSIPGLQLDDQDFKEALRLRLLMPSHDDPVPFQRRCRSCNKDNVEELHGLSCKGASISRKIRHDLIRDALVKFIRSAVPEAQVMVETPIPNNLANKGQLTADIMIQQGHKVILLDVAITNPAAPSALRRNGPRTIVAGSAAEAKEKKKISLYKESYGQAIESSLVPFVLESTGRLGGMAKQFVEKLSGFLLPNMLASSSLQAARQFLAQRMAVILIKGNSKMIRVARSQIQILRT